MTGLSHDVHDMAVRHSKWMKRLKKDATAMTSWVGVLTRDRGVDAPIIEKNLQFIPFFRLDETPL